MRVSIAFFSIILLLSGGKEVITIDRNVISTISEMKFHNNYLFIVGDKRDGLLYKYDVENEKVLQEYGGYGEGPGEHGDLTDFDIHGDYIYSYDVTQHRVNKFHIENGFVDSWVIEDRLTDILVDENHLYGFNSTGISPGSELAVIYDLADMEKVYGGYEVSDLLEDLAIGSMGPANFMAGNEEYMYFSHSYELILEQVSKSDYTSSRIDLSGESGIYEVFDGGRVEPQSGDLGSRISASSPNLHIIGDMLYMIFRVRNEKDYEGGPFFIEKYNLETYELEGVADLGSYIVMYIDERFIYANNTKELHEGYSEFKNYSLIVYLIRASLDRV